MSTLILKASSRLYGIVKVYLALATVGALSVLAVGLVSAKPVGVLLSVIAVSFGVMGIVFWVEKQKRIWAEHGAKHYKRVMRRRRIEPPKVAEALLTFVLPSNLRDPIVADLHEEFYRLLKFGELSAATWYAIEAYTILVRVTVLWLSLRATDVLIKDVLKRDSRL